MAVMAWFKKERKQRTSNRERLEIPADAWEKCDVCGVKVGLYSGYRCSNPECRTLFCMDCNSGGFYKQCPRCGSTAA